MANHYVGQMCIYDRRIWKPSHGPQTWPWWRLVSISIVKCSHDPDCLFWNVPLTYTVWIYTRRWIFWYPVRIIKRVYIARDLWDAALTRWHKEEEEKRHGKNSTHSS